MSLRPILSFFVCLYLASLGRGFIFSSFPSEIQKLQSFCVEDLLSSSSQKAFFQNSLSNTSYIMPSNGSATEVPIPKNFKIAKAECPYASSVAFVDSQINELYHFDKTTNDLQKVSNGTEDIIDFEYIKIQGDECLLVVKNHHVIELFYLAQGLTAEGRLYSESFAAPDTMASKIQCFDSLSEQSVVCFLLSTDGQSLSYFKVSEDSLPQVTLRKHSVASNFYNDGTAALLAVSQSLNRIYVGMNTGLIKEYTLNADGVMSFHRLTNQSHGQELMKLHVNELSNQLLFVNNRSQLGVIDLSENEASLKHGALITWHNISAFMPNFQIKLTQINADQFMLFHPDHFTLVINVTLFQDENLSIQSSHHNLNQICPPGQFIAAQTPNHGQGLNQIDLSCLPCNRDNHCESCDQESAECYQCSEGFYTHQGSCIDCQFGENFQPQQYSVCFDEDQIQVLVISSQVTDYVTDSVEFSYTVLSGSALLFIFLRFINFWSIVSIYYFLNMDLPYFLLHSLQSIFEILYGSILVHFGVDLSSVSLGTSQSATASLSKPSTNQKFRNSIVSTDFLISNFESIIIFAYSSVIVCTVYYYFKKQCKKCEVHILQKVRIQACFQQFLAIFTPLLVPIYHFINSGGYFDFLNKLNTALQFAFFGLVMVFPGIYIVSIAKRVTLKQRVLELRNNLKTQKLISKSQSVVNESQSTACRNDKSGRWGFLPISQQEGQKLIHCIQCICVAFLVSFQTITLFLWVIFTVNFLSVWNANYARNWRQNIIFEKAVLFLYHLCYIMMFYFPVAKNVCSIVALLLILIGGIHELLTAMAEKVFFVYLIYSERKRQNRILNECCSDSHSSVEQNSKQAEGSKPHGQIAFSGFRIKKKVMQTETQYQFQSSNEHFKTSAHEIGVNNTEQLKVTSQVLQRKVKRKRTKKKCVLNIQQSTTGHREQKSLTVDEQQLPEEKQPQVQDLIQNQTGADKENISTDCKQLQIRVPQTKIKFRKNRPRQGRQDNLRRVKLLFVQRTNIREL